MLFLETRLLFPLRPRLVETSGTRRESGCVDLYGDGYSAGDHVVDSGSGPRLLDEVAQLLGGRVALDRETDRDVAVAVGDRGIEPEDAVEVDVAGDGGTDLGEFDPSSGGDVGQT